MLDVEWLKDELVAINHHTEENWINTRVHQIGNYWRLLHFHEGAELIKQAAKDFDLKGDFKILETLRSVVIMDFVYISAALN